MEEDLQQVLLATPALAEVARLVARQQKQIAGGHWKAPCPHMFWMCGPDELSMGSSDHERGLMRMMTELAPSRKRNRVEMQQAHDDFKQRFHPHRGFLDGDEQPLEN